LPSFKRDLKKVECNIENFENLKQFLEENPTAGDVIKGTHGLRKIRWVLAGNKGKSGSNRIIYYFYRGDDLLFLISVYSKNDKENISEGDKKKYIGIIKEIFNNK
jgi:hypothetical protein